MKWLALIPIVLIFIIYACRTPQKKKAVQTDDPPEDYVFIDKDVQDSRYYFS